MLLLTQYVQYKEPVTIGKIVNNLPKIFYSLYLMSLPVLPCRVSLRPDEEPMNSMGSKDSSRNIWAKQGQEWDAVAHVKGQDYPPHPFWDRLPPNPWSRGRGEAPFIGNLSSFPDCPF